MTRRRPGARRLLIVAGVAVLFLAPLHAQVDNGHLRLFKYLMGTSMRVEIYGATSSVRQQAADEAFAAIAQVDRGMSDYRDDSELARLNASAGRGAVPVSGPLFALLAAGERVWRASGGAFSTVSGSRGGDRPLVLDATTGSVRLGPAGGRVSLNGLAKGFAAEVAAGSLARRGLSGTVEAAPLNTSFSVSVNASPAAGLSMSTAQASVPEVPVRGSSRPNLGSRPSFARFAAYLASRSFFVFSGVWTS